MSVCLMIPTDKCHLSLVKHTKIELSQRDAGFEICKLYTFSVQQFLIAFYFAIVSPSELRVRFCTAARTLPYVRCLIYVGNYVDVTLYFRYSEFQITCVVYRPLCDQRVRLGPLGAASGRRV